MIKRLCSRTQFQANKSQVLSRIKRLLLRSILRKYQQFESEIWVSKEIPIFSTNWYSIELIGSDLSRLEGNPSFPGGVVYLQAWESIVLLLTLGVDFCYWFLV